MFNFYMSQVEHSKKLTQIVYPLGIGTPYKISGDGNTLSNLLSSRKEGSRALSEYIFSNNVRKVSVPISDLEEISGS